MNTLKVSRGNEQVHFPDSTHANLGIKAGTGIFLPCLWGKRRGWFSSMSITYRL